MLANALPPVLQAPVAPPASSQNATGNGEGPDSFARLLGAADARRQAETATARAAEAKSAEAKPTEAADGGTPPAEPTAPTGTAADHPTEEPSEDSTAAAGEAAGGPQAVDGAPGADAAALLAGLAGLPRPLNPDAPARAFAAGLGRSAARQAGSIEGQATESGARRAADTLDAASGARRPGGGATAPGGAEGPAGSHFTQLMRQAREGAETSTAQAADANAQRLQAAAMPATETRPAAADTTLSPAALLATTATAGAAAGGPGSAAGLPAEGRLGASPGTPEFATQLGAQLSTFVREGVQHARLELHPVELGPVTVQIALDGTTARVNLAAEHAATRQALEQALPALAGSLREAGLTLSGGGVFEQPQQPQPDGGTGDAGGRGRSSGNSGSAENSGPAAGDTPAGRRRGVVDLVA